MMSEEFKINQASLFIEAFLMIDQMDNSSQKHDGPGYIFEYILNHMSISGRNGEFRASRRIIPQQDQFAAVVRRSETLRGL
jgi:hypothetical protein